MAGLERSADELASSDDYGQGCRHGQPPNNSSALGMRINRIGHQEHRRLVPRQWLMGRPGQGRLRLGARSLRARPWGARWNLHGSNQLVGLGQHLLYFLKTGAAGHTAPEVLLDLADFCQIQLTVEECVQRAFIKMRHCCPVLPLYMLPPIGAGPGPASCPRRLWRVPRWR